MTNAGLPRVVVSLLRHMESHKDCLKWNITEGSHKITLTLTWNFRKHKGTLMDRLQRTLKLGRSVDDGQGVPAEVLKLIENSPKQRPSSLSPHPSQIQSPRHRQAGWGRSQSFNAPSSTSSSTNNPHKVLRRGTSLHAYSPLPLPRSISGIGASTMMSARSLDAGLAAQYWPLNDTSPITLPRQHQQQPVRYGTPLTRAATIDANFSPNVYVHTVSTHSPYVLSRSNSNYTPHSSRPASQEDLICAVPNVNNRVKLTYRTEEDIEKSLESLMAKTKEHTKKKLAEIQQEWSQTVRDWPKSLDDDHDSSRDTELNTSTDLSDQSMERITSQVSNDTVQKCLSSCDKILSRNSTVIK